MKYSGPIVLSAFTIGLIINILGCKKQEIYKDPNQPVDIRVHDLISRMTIDEKISQLIDVADSIPRLGIPEYNWWNEGLHGVARAGTATVFPQAIGMAASFDDSLMYNVATVISDEFRAKYNEAIRKNVHERYNGLTVWSPNINLFRDPRWGRGQETYGEDPYLTSRMGVVFVRGLQGNNPKYLKTIATLKHYAVHSGPEPLRHTFNVDVSESDFMDTYLTAFEACVKEGKAGSVMSAYNRFRGESCTGSPLLLTEILRTKWGFEGYVVSDCGAVDDICYGHKITGSIAEAAAIALKSGCDLNCGDSYRHLKEALDKGFITEADLDTALRRLFEARFRLGMFDPQESVPYNKIPIEVNDNTEHRDLAKKMACESMVLLRNEGQILPLKKDLKTIAVIGPSADNAEVMYGNYNGFPSKYTTVLGGIKSKVSPSVQVLYSRGVYYHQDFPLPETVSSKFIQSEGKKGFKGEYFSNINLEGQPQVVKTDDNILFWWGPNRPVNGVTNEKYSVRWTGDLKPPGSGIFKFRLSGDGGFRLFIDNKPVIEKWENHPFMHKEVSVALDCNKTYLVRVEYFHISSNAFFGFEWAFPKFDLEEEAIAIAKKSDVIVFVGGLSPTLEGEEMFIDLEGFHGGDRTSLNLPNVQENMLKKLKATGKPVILVLMNGSALALNWASKNIPAILEAWYPGQDGGAAIADVLFGDYNPAGRLPVTFYKSTDQLPSFEDYNMKGRTYRYFEGTPLYEFGYGLSYTKFKYSNLVAPQSISTDSIIIVSVEVENTGDYAGDEVVQLYLKHKEAQIPVPIHALQGFKRIFLEKGQQKKVEFAILPRQVSVINNENKRVVIPGNLTIFVGGGQPESTKIKKGEVLTSDLKITGDQYMVE
jgi:beta-glucosidase